MVKLSLVEQMSVPRGGTAFDAYRTALENAHHAEAHGFHRMWFAEHHGIESVAAHSPEILMAVMARETDRLRIGSGAILLNNYSPLKVAELFLQLEVTAPGRFDLGLGRATSGPLVDMALKRDRNASVVNDFDQQVQEVLAYLHRDFPVDHPFHKITLMPTVKARPEPWLLGSSGSSAGLAAALGVGYSFGGFLNPNAAVAALQHYRKHFRPTQYGEQTPQAMLSICVFAADTDAEAHRMTWPTRAVFARAHISGETRVFPTIEEAEGMLTTDQRDAPSVIAGTYWPAQLAGSPRTLREQISRMIEQTGATEIMLQSVSPDQEARRHTHALIAEILGVRTTPMGGAPVVDPAEAGASPA